jgi:hypothetical protein
MGGSTTHGVSKKDSLTTRSAAARSAGAMRDTASTRTAAAGGAPVP